MQRDFGIEQWRSFSGAANGTRGAGLLVHQLNMQSHSTID